MSPSKESAEIQHIRVTLHALVQERSKTVERFAHENGMEQSVLSKFFSGKSVISLPNFLRVAEALNIEIGSLVPPKKGTILSSGKTSIYDTRSTRRSKVTVAMDETRTIDIKKKASDSKPVISLRLH